MFASTKKGIYPGMRRAALNLVAGSLWHVPGSFRIARILGSRYIVRVALFHHIAGTESDFTRGLGVTVSCQQFEAALKFITRHYTPVSLQEVITAAEGEALPPRPILLTFDDAYASVSKVAASSCVASGVPAVLFANGGFLDNRHLAMENLICYVANVHGLKTVNAAIRSVEGIDRTQVKSLSQVFSRFLPRTSLAGREAFRRSLVKFADISEADLAAEAGLYLSSQQLRELTQFGFEIGNHTYSHANCRTLSPSDFVTEIDRNRSVLEGISGTEVTSFSVPYGSSIDLPEELAQHLCRSGYKAVFLADGKANLSPIRGSQFDRISIKANTDAALFSEIEVLPRIRSFKRRLLADHWTKRPPRVAPVTIDNTKTGLPSGAKASQVEISQY
jgi:peptidoglycan/xylan/chitin deacetylase (PgdA/CDA1 family)